MKRFPLGEVVVTLAAMDLLAPEDAARMLTRHVNGDWGMLPPEDAILNAEALIFGGRIMSVYEAPAGEPVWIITEADRSATTILLPDEY